MLSPMTLTAACTAAIGIATSISAQEISVPEAPFYRFVTTIDDAAQFPDGSKGNVIVQYFAMPDGSVGSVNFVAVRKNQSDCGVYKNKKGQICWCDLKSPTGESCFGGNVGPFSAPVDLSLSVNIEPKTEADGAITFDVSVQQVLATPMNSKTVSGFVINEDGSFTVSAEPLQ